MPWRTALVDSKILSVHAALVPGRPKGKVVMLGGNEHWSDQADSDTEPAPDGAFEKCAVYDVDAQADAVEIDSPTTDVFCAGHAFLADGRFLIGGGTESWTGGAGPGAGHEGHFHGQFGGHRSCWIFNQDRDTWDLAAEMQFETGPGQGGGRWYPTIITLPSGDLVAFGGHPSRHSNQWHENDIPERYWTNANAWTWYPAQIGFDAPPPVPGFLPLPAMWYPRGNLVTGGKIFFTTSHDDECVLFDPSSGAVEKLGIAPPGGLYSDSWDFATIALPLVPGDGYRSRIMAVDDTKPRFIDLDFDDGTPAWADTPDRDPAVADKQRRYACPVYLPTGQIFLSGGIDGGSDTDAVLEPEVFTPGIDWNTLEYSGPIGSWELIDESAQKARNYHSVALLLPDGSVFVSGSNIDGASGNPVTKAQRNIEIYEPAWFGDADRPTIQADSAPLLVTPSDTSLSFSMVTATQAGLIEKVALIRCGSVTHSGDFDQRYVALDFDTAGSTITATLPADPTVTPPGYYMLWAVTSGELPCKVAPFVRVGHVNCDVVAGPSTFSQEQVESLGDPAAFPFALYAVFDGFLPKELPTSLDVDVRWGDTGASIPTSDIRVTSSEVRWLEYPDEHTEVGQRITYPFTIEFRDPTIFDTFTDSRPIDIRFTAGAHECGTELWLSKSPNPYMLDIKPEHQNPHWLSTDIRTLRVRAGETRYGIPHGSGDSAPEAFGKAVIDHFKGIANNDAHPFEDLPREGSAAAVDLAPTDGGQRVYNYAIARVRYRATTTTTGQIKAFFRLCTTVETGLEYNSDRVYRNAGSGASTVPALGLAGDELLSVPFFLGRRVNTVSGQPGATSMASQPLVPNYEVQTIAPVPGDEAATYFMVWLDVNEPEVKRFPIAPGTDHGPWPEAASRSIQELFRSPHHCLVTEIFYDEDPTQPGATPASSDNLSQRNLTLLPSDNPGALGSRHVVHPIELKPSPVDFLRFPAIGAPVAHAMVNFVPQKFGPDELLINWHNLPRDAEVTLYFSNVDTANIEALAGRFRSSQTTFRVIDDVSLRLPVANHSWIPIPGGVDENIPALLSIQLPDTVKSGEEYRVSVHQVDGRTRTIVGSVEIAIPVSKASLLLSKETQTYSIMSHIGTTIPSTNRWYPIFQRYLGFLAERIDGLGGDSGSIHPNPDGSGTPYTPPTTPSGPETGGGTVDGETVRKLIETCCRKLTQAALAVAGAAVVSSLVRCACGRPRRRCTHDRDQC